MFLSLTWWSVIVLDLIVWSSWALLAGWWHRRTPTDALAPDGPILQLRAFETGGDWYEERLRIRAWKDRLPETGSRFGASKRHLRGHDVDDLEWFAAECRRGERTHWTVVAGTIPCAVWTPGGWLLALTGANAAGNAPFVAVLRYNRARIAAILDRPRRAGIPSTAPGAA